MKWTDKRIAKLDNEKVKKYGFIIGILVLLISIGLNIFLACAYHTQAKLNDKFDLTYWEKFIISDFDKQSGTVNHQNDVNKDFSDLLLNNQDDSDDYHNINPKIVNINRVGVNTQIKIVFEDTLQDEPYGGIKEKVFYNCQLNLFKNTNRYFYSHFDHQNL